MSLKLTISTKEIDKEAREGEYYGTKGYHTERLLEEDYIPYVSDKERGIVYLFYMEMGTMSCTKIGVTMRNHTDRMCEVLLDFYQKFRYVPYCKPMKYTTVLNPYGMEKELKEYFKEDNVKFTDRFSGSTEFFYTDIDIIKEKYIELLDTYKK